MAGVLLDNCSLVEAGGLLLKSGFVLEAKGKPAYLSTLSKFAKQVCVWGGGGRRGGGGGGTPRPLHSLSSPPNAVATSACSSKKPLPRSFTSIPPHVSDLFFACPSRNPAVARRSLHLACPGSACPGTLTSSRHLLPTAMAAV